MVISPFISYAFSTLTVNSKADLFSRVVIQVMEPLTLSIRVLDTICLIIGGAFIFGAVGRYVQHRHNPGQSPIGQSLFLGFLGVVLLLLPMIGKYALPSR
jgi:hypothetical protein